MLLALTGLVNAWGVAMSGKTDADDAVGELHTMVDNHSSWLPVEGRKLWHGKIDRVIEATENKFQVMGYEQGKREENEACVGMLRALVGSGEAFDCRELYVLIGKMERRARIGKEGG